MNDTAVVTLIVVSAALTFFLIAFTVGLIYLISILKQVKRITERAENVADSVESAAAAFERTASPLAVLKIIGSIIENANKIRRRKD